MFWNKCLYQYHKKYGGSFLGGEEDDGLLILTWKDRALAVAMNCVNRFGLKKMIIASSGNASAAAAAYAARAGVELIAVVPDSTSANKTRQAMCHGAQVVKVPGNYSRS